MDSSDDLPPLTFPAIPLRQSQKQTSPPCIVTLAVAPFHCSAVGFIGAAVAKQIMFARGRINQSFADLESMVQVRLRERFALMLLHSLQSEIEAVADLRRKEFASIDADSANDNQGLALDKSLEPPAHLLTFRILPASDISTFPVRLPLALNKFNRNLSAFQCNTRDLFDFFLNYFLASSRVVSSRFRRSRKIVLHESSVLHSVRIWIFNCQSLRSSSTDC